MQSKNEILINKTFAKRVLSVVDAGLTEGVGNPVPGEMCVMAAINYAAGMTHGDNPETCVGEAVRTFDIAINDSAWSDNAARANGMRREAIAKLGSNKIDQVAFANEMALRSVRVFVPIALRAAAALCSSHSDNLNSAAIACENVGDLRAAWSAVWSAESAAGSAARSAESAAGSAGSAARSAARSAAGSAAGSAARSAESAAGSAARSAESAAWSAARSAESAAWSAARSAESAARSAVWSAESVASSAAESAARDAVLTRACEEATEVLIALNSPGTKFLYLTE